MSMSQDEASEALRVSQAVQQHLVGLGPQLQGAVLADLLALWLAGHMAEGEKRTAQLREQMLAMHLDVVRKLVKPSEQMLLTRMKSMGRA
jgi:uncharacterized membrane protein YfbV (UPF0208 family)